MGRGQGKGTDLGNNGTGCEPWTWEVTDHFGNETPMEWSSLRHKLRIVKTYVNRYVIATDRGQFIRGPAGRERRFKSLFSAMVAADNVGKVKK